MSLFDAFRFDGKRVLVVGGATGMGAAAAEVALDAGAEVIVMDYADVTLAGAQAIKVNLAERDSIDAALAEVDGPIDAHLACAGVADGTPGLERINFVGHRYLIDRLLESDRLPRGSAIGFISSAAGLGWESNLEKIKEVLAISDWDESVQWCQENGYADYFHTKQIICAYVATQAHHMIKRGIRINAICPGPTETPLAKANEEMWLGFGSDWRDEVGIDASSPLEQAYPLLFLCSAAAVAVNGITLITDEGYMMAGITNTYEPAAGAAGFLMGRLG
jgi:NAD(P)-dependent dehydrogenase (short-subunit alcohol dehydrogenase family)